MQWVNYHHLLYFWLVARQGGLAAAAAELRLAPSTVSKQIHQFEQSLGHALFAKTGRRLIVNDRGAVVFRYADEIFSLGRDMLDALQDRPPGRPLRLRVGIAPVVPKLTAAHVLAPALRLPDPVLLVCVEGRPERLLADLAVRDLDVVLTDAPAGELAGIRAFTHPVGESPIAIFGRPDLAGRYRRRFPASLEGAPFLLPTANTALRRSLDQWLETLNIRVNVVGECADSALLNVFGAQGVGLFPAAAVMRREIESHYHARIVGMVADVRETFYAVTLDRRSRNPAVAAICDGGRDRVSGTRESPRRGRPAATGLTRRGA